MAARGSLFLQVPRCRLLVKVLRHVGLVRVGDRAYATAKYAGDGLAGAACLTRRVKEILPDSRRCLVLTFVNVSRPFIHYRFHFRRFLTCQDCGFFRVIVNFLALCGLWASSLAYYTRY